MNASDSVRVRVPGSTSNLGPGFDCLGLALRIYNEVVLTRGPAGASSGTLTLDDGEAPPFFREAVQAFFAAASIDWFSAIAISINCHVPRSRGLGSSAALRVGILAGLNHLHETPLQREQIAALVTQLEGHPDNAAASVHGGFCVSRTDAAGSLIDVQSFPVSERLFFACLSPAIELETRASRALLPESLSLQAAARNINSVAFLVSVFASGRYEQLRAAIEDHLHQPARLPSIPGAREAISASMAAGALTGFLSGSGSSVISIADEPERAQVAARAMESAFAAAGVPSQARVLQADNHGYVIDSGG